ncbi:MAG: ROK family protein [Bacteroidales bacterium]|nr:ROK family protein [Bacteroidales bacterium]
MAHSIGIDIGGTNTDMGLINEDGIIVARRNLPTNRYTDFDLYINDISRELQAMTSAAGVEIDGIGIGAPNGNFYTGCVDNAPNLTIKGNLDFEHALGSRFSVPVALSNDANAAAYGEYVYGGARGMKHFVMFTLGTGVGSGIVVDGRLVHGSTGAAGELGHNILVPGGRQCSCGRCGCLEAYTSARGIVQTYRELYRAAHGAEPDQEITSKLVGQKAHEGDPTALETWHQTAHWLGIAMSNAVGFSSPEAIFLMGGPAQVGDPLLVPLRQEFEANTLYIFHNTCRIMMSQLKANEVAILGAAALIKMKQQKV